MIQTTGHEKAVAAAVNVSSIFFPYLGPIVGALIAGKSKFIRFHAYRCLIDQIVTTVVIAALVMLSLAFSVYSLSNSMADGFDLSKVDWVMLLVKSLATWVLIVLWGVVNTVLSIRDALEALNGQLPSRPKWTERKAMIWSGL
jgi:uncharacterized membrane protein